MTDFDDDFDLDESYPDEDLYPDYTKRSVAAVAVPAITLWKPNSVSNVWEPEKLVR